MQRALQEPQEEYSEADQYIREESTRDISLARLLIGTRVLKWFESGGPPDPGEGTIIGFVQLECPQGGFFMHVIEYDDPNVEGKDEVTYHQAMQLHQQFQSFHKHQPAPIPLPSVTPSHEENTIPIIETTSPMLIPSSLLNYLVSFSHLGNLFSGYPTSKGISVNGIFTWGIRPKEGGDLVWIDNQQLQNSIQCLKTINNLRQRDKFQKLLP